MRRFLLTFLSLLSATAMAQEAPVKRTCRILFLDRPSGAPAKLHLFDGQTTREVDLPGMNLSPVHEMPSGALKLLLLPEPPADPALPPEGAPSAEVPAEMADFYLIVFSDPANPVTPVRLQVVDAESGKTKLGQTIWVNFTDLVISGKLGDQDLLIEPQANATMGQPREDAGDYQVKISYNVKDQEAVYPVCETRWEHDPRRRNLGFVISQGEGSAPRVMVFPDFRSARP
jgi:hypothetical protein